MKLRALLAALTTVLIVVGVVSPASAAPCPWGTQCLSATLVTPVSGATLSGTVALEARAQVTQPERGTIYSVEWWLYNTDFTRQVPQNGEGKVLLAESFTPSSGTVSNGTWKGTWTVPASKTITARDGAYDLPGTRTYTMPASGYKIQAHVLDQEWVRTWGGPPGHSADAPVAIDFGGGAPPVTPSPTPSTPVQANQVRIGAATRNLDGTNVYRATGQLIRYTGTKSPANQYGVEVAVGADGKVASVSAFKVGMTIPSGGYVLSGHDDSADWLLANAPVGATVQIGGTAPPTTPPTTAPPTSSDVTVGGSTRTLNGTNIPRAADALVLYTGTRSPANMWGFEAAVSGGKVTAISSRQEGMAIPSGGFVLSGHGASEAWLQANAKVGTTVTLGSAPPTTPPTASPSPTSTTPPDTGLAATGRWTVSSVSTPSRGIHATLLRDGRVLLLAGSGNDEGNFDAGTFKSSIWNPTTNTFKEIPTPYDMFCGGHVTLPDGRVLISGGTEGYAGHNGAIGFIGSKKSYVFDPATDAYSAVNETIQGHWYPTLTKLENGNIWSVGGYDNRDGVAKGATAVEMFDSAASRWLPSSATVQTNRYWGTYPHFYLLANGNLFFTGAYTFGNSPTSTGSVVHNWRNGTSGDITGLRDRQLRDQAGSVLLPPAQNQTFMIVGGGSTDRGGSTNSVDLINMNAATPSWIPGPTLPGAEGRMYVNLATLPNRTVLASNGSTGPRAGNVLRAATYNPATNAWTTVAADPIGRNYHSSSLVLLDGRVAVFGSNPADGSFEMRVSIYEPGYLFKGTRPVINSAPTGVTYGESISLGVTGTVAAASLTSVGSATHQLDTNARLVDLPISGTGGMRSAIVPSNPALLPPGPYMLTVLDSNGVPSVARMVSVR